MEGLEQAITKITELKAGLPALASELARASEWLSRRDQVRGLEEAAQEVLKRVQAAISSEMLVQQQYLGQAGARVAFGLLTDVANLIISRRIPPKTLEPTEQPPFRTVLVTVGPRGVPDDLAEVNVSWLAQKAGISHTGIPSDNSTKRSLAIPRMLDKRQNHGGDNYGGKRLRLLSRRGRRMAQKRAAFF